MKCQYCKGNCIKKGCYKRRQLYQCKSCKKYQRTTYVKPKIQETKKNQIKLYHNEGLGISSISRLLTLSKSSVQRKLTELAKQQSKPAIHETQQVYEVDELRTYIGNKKQECWIIYALNKNTKQVIDFVVGRRTKANIKKIIDALNVLKPKKIFTDKLATYTTLISNNMHVASAYKINHIERRNLELRKDIKCLNRKTICYSKSQEMLTTKLKLYFNS